MSIDTGKLVRQAREAKGWSQEKLAEEAGTSQTTIDKIERGETKRSRFLEKIAEVLGTKLVDIDPDYSSLGGPHAYLQGQYAKIDNHEKNRIPLYASFPRRDGTFELAPTAAGRIQKPDIVYYSDTAYAFYISNFDLSPEFEPGDIAIVDPELDGHAGSTCVFFSSEESSLITRRIIGFDDNDWRLARWHPEPAEEIRSREEWPGCHRIVMRQLRK